MAITEGDEAVTTVAEEAADEGAAARGRMVAAGEAAESETAESC